LSASKVKEREKIQKERGEKESIKEASKRRNTYA